MVNIPVKTGSGEKSHIKALSALERVVEADHYTNDEWKRLVRGVDFSDHLKELENMETAIRATIRRLQEAIELRETALLDLQQERTRYEQASLAWNADDNERSN